jgi:hypothetical protein
MIGGPAKVYLVGMLVYCSVFTITDTSARDDDLSFACEKNGATRFVEVVSDPEYACRVKYTKSSATTFPWNARNEANYCHPKAIGLIEKLGGLGWECESTENVKTVLLDQIERYGRYIKILNNVGKTCYFYPSEAQFGNLCGDERKEAVIVYTCDVDADTDDWNQHLAVFLELESEPLIREVGGSGYRQVSSYHIDDERLMIETEKVEFVEGSNTAKYPVEKSSIQCQYSDSSEWELIEK